ncbi:hypothetical protein LguiB_006940 [Lonicera macranthoides]
MKKKDEGRRNRTNFEEERRRDEEERRREEDEEERRRDEEERRKTKKDEGMKKKDEGRECLGSELTGTLKTCCFDNESSKQLQVAWPIFALAYPLFASIRAIETNSNHHMRKLLTYWILFSLISLFEHTFVKFLEWFPLWAYIKIIAIFWLVLPRFRRACHAYKSLVLMRSYVNLQVINQSNKQDKEPFLKTEEMFLSMAKKFIKENGSEALEEFIANKLAITNLDAKEKMAVTITEKKEMATTMESKGAKPDVEQIKAPANTEEKEKATKNMSLVAKPNRDVQENMAVTITEKKEMATTIGSKGAKPDVEQIKAPANTEEKEKATKIKSWVAKPNLDAKEKMAVTFTEIKEMATTIESKGAKPDMEENKAPANKEEKEKATKNMSWVAKPNLDAKEKMAVTFTKIKEMAPTIESKGAKPDMEEIKGTANTEEKENATKIKSEGAKPNLDAEEINVANIEKKETAAIEVKRANTSLVETERRKPEVVEVTEMNYCPSSLDKVQRQWTCAVCQVTTTSQTTLNSHFQGKKHIAKCQELKAKKQTPKNNYSPLSSTTNKLGQANQNPNKGTSGDGVNQTKSKQQEKKVQLNNGNIKSKKDNAEKQHWCTVCNVRCSGPIDLVSHLKGKWHLSMVGDFAEKQHYWCSVCNVRCSGPIDLVSHLKGKWHLSMVGS